MRVNYDKKDGIINPIYSIKITVSNIKYLKLLEIF